MVDRIVIDPARRAECGAAISAAHEHHVAAISKTEWLNTREHIDIVVRARARAIDGEKNLSHQPFRIDWLAENDVATKVHGRASVKRRNYTAVLCVYGANTPNPTSGQIHATNKKIARRIDVQCAPRRGIRNVDRIHPSQSAVGRSSELSAAVVVSIRAPALILEAVAGTVGVIDREPLFITAIRRADTRP